MALTSLTSREIRDSGGIGRVDLITSIAGQAVIAKLIAGTNVSLLFTGADPGTGDVTVDVAQGPLIIPGVLTPTTLAANIDDYSPPNLHLNLIIRMSSSLNIDLTGLDSTLVASGQMFHLVNVGDFDIKMMNNNFNSLAANRFILQTDETIKPDNAATIWYDIINARFRTFSQYIT